MLSTFPNTAVSQGPPSLPILHPKLNRCHARQLMKRVHEMAVVLEADRGGDVLDRASSISY